MNSNSLLFRKNKNKQTSKNIYMKIEFLNLVVRLSFLCCKTDIKTAWIYTLQYITAKVL